MQREAIATRFNCFVTTRDTITKPFDSIKSVHEGIVAMFDRIEMLLDCIETLRNYAKKHLDTIAGVHTRF